MLDARDAEFLREMLLDAMTHVGEHYGDDAEVVAATVVLVVRDDDGVHVANVCAER